MVWLDAKTSVTARRRIRSAICRSAGESGSEKLLWRFSKKLFAEICFFCALTPELSRADLRPRRATILPWPAEAAKRSRLERIVRRLTSDAFAWLTYRTRVQAKEFRPAAQNWFCAPAMLFTRTCDRRRSAAALRLHGVCGRREPHVAVPCDATTHDYKIFVWRRLTPELSRAAKRRRLE